MTLPNNGSKSYSPLRAGALRTFSPINHFYKLPVELRLAIYTLILDTTSKSTCNKISLLLVSKQVHRECYSIALRYLDLKFPSFDAFMGFWKSLPNNLHDKIAQITIPAHRPEVLYEVPRAIQWCCRGIHLHLLTLVLDFPAESFYEHGIGPAKLTTKAHAYLDEVHSIGKIEFVSPRYENVVKLATHFRKELYFVSQDNTSLQREGPVVISAALDLRGMRGQNYIVGRWARSREGRWDRAI